MKTRSRMERLLRGIGGAALMAAMLYAALAVPGMLSDRNSTAPALAQEARR